MVQDATYTVFMGLRDKPSLCYEYTLGRCNLSLQPMLAPEPQTHPALDVTSSHTITRRHSFPVFGTTTPPTRLFVSLSLN
jgi:hypothetical protein